MSPPPVLSPNTPPLLPAPPPQPPPQPIPRGDGARSSQRAQCAREPRPFAPFGPRAHVRERRHLGKVEEHCDERDSADGRGRRGRGWGEQRRGSNARALARRGAPPGTYRVSGGTSLIMITPAHGGRRTASVGRGSGAASSAIWHIPTPKSALRAFTSALSTVLILSTPALVASEAMKSKSARAVLKNLQ
jgi:hypothetical protein